MTPSQRIWTEAGDGRARELAALGYPQEIADVLAGQLGSPRAIDRMASYLRLAHPGSMEMIVDEMLAICAEIDAWREKKESRDAQESYNLWLRSEERRRNAEEP